MLPETLMATKPQIQKINVLLKQLTFMYGKGFQEKEYKEALVMAVSNQRTTHISELSKLEAKNMITHLISQNPLERNKEAIIALAYKAGIIWGYTYEDKKMNMVKLDAFLLRQGTVKKRFCELNYEDTIKVHRQFEAIVNSQRRTAANKATASVLKELGISVQKPIKSI